MDIRVAIFQPVAREETPSARLDRLEAQLVEAGANAFDLLLCPELFLSGYDVGDKIREFAEPASGPSLARVGVLAKKYETALGVGYPEIEGQELYNSVAVVGKSGERLHDYRKRFLPPGYEGDTFTAGRDDSVFEFMGQRFAVLICYDVEFPENVRKAAKGGAEIILAPTALRSKWDFVARKMIPTRAFENGLFLLYANYAGRERNSEYLGESVIVAPDGRALALAGDGEEVISANLDMAEISLARHTLPYLKVMGKNSQSS
ncbi:MAG: carbon-nitrogen hydrolase family protein [Rhodospirillaceae bacterium]|nr:carbon-nitrogen hydrolase family protein [Rhodospirillaceae bacterium]MBL6929956.1 carbon-nitrogen hydrolase family protein [Rhodospirillales bacterium]